MDAIVNVGIIGTGKISGEYLQSCASFPNLRVAACADLEPHRAAEKAAEFGIAKACSVEELLRDPQIELVVNLTVPLSHADVSLAAIESGKHVFSEKPLAVTLEEGQAILEAAERRGVLVGCAPATHIGGGHQTVRQLVDAGSIGTPVAATAFLASHGPESWHPNPAFYYQRGGGPLLDMGPYYITALINLLGPVRKVSGFSRTSFPERIATSPEQNGLRIPVEVPTHVTALLEFEGGAIASLITSFDIWAHSLPRIEVHGSEGSLSVPDPNRFDGSVRLFRPEEPTWSEIPLTHSPHVKRGIGVADLARSIRSGKPSRVSGQLAYHVLEVMFAIEESSETGAHISIHSTCARPDPLPPFDPEQPVRL